MNHLNPLNSMYMFFFFLRTTRTRLSTVHAWWSVLSNPDSLCFVVSGGLLCIFPSDKVLRCLETLLHIADVCIDYSWSGEQPHRAISRPYTVRTFYSMPFWKVLACFTQLLIASQSLYRPFDVTLVSLFSGLAGKLVRIFLFRLNIREILEIPSGLLRRVNSSLELIFSSLPRNFYY